MRVTSPKVLRTSFRPCLCGCGRLGRVSRARRSRAAARRLASVRRVAVGACGCGSCAGWPPYGALPLAPRPAARPKRKRPADTGAETEFGTGPPVPRPSDALCVHCVVRSAAGPPRRSCGLRRGPWFERVPSGWVAAAAHALSCKKNSFYVKNMNFEFKSVTGLLHWSFAFSL